MPRLKTIHYDVNLLKLLRRPCTAYDIKKELDYPYGSVKLFLDRYLENGIVKIVKKEPARTGLYKKYYQLSEAGVLLLRLVEMLESQARS